MKRIALAILASVVLGLVLYGLVAFISWEAHPGEWEERARAAAAFLWAGLIGCLAGYLLSGEAV